MILPIGSTHEGGTTRPQGVVLRKKLQDQTEDDTAQRNSHGHVRTPFDVTTVDGQLCEVSISHDTDWATAMAIVPTVTEWEIERRTE